MEVPLTACADSQGSTESATLLVESWPSVSQQRRTLTGSVSESALGAYVWS